VPPVLGQLMGGSDRERAGRVMQAMLKMNKLIIKDLEEA
jgi:predicted 3-demethylubiquinone-9 3-methyltransferase (glyoxalase superfamily)